jgi:hypothetical protein
MESIDDKHTEYGYEFSPVLNSVDSMLLLLHINFQYYVSIMIAKISII